MRRISAARAIEAARRVYDLAGGAALLRLEWLAADGEPRLGETFADCLAPVMLFSERAIAFTFNDDGRPHAIYVRCAFVDGDELTLISNRTDLRFVVSPVWTPEQRAQATDAHARGLRPENAHRELVAFLRAANAERPVRRRKPKPIKLRVSSYARASEGGAGELHTIGYRIASANELVAKFLPPYTADEQADSQQMRGMLTMSGREPFDVLDDMVDRANGVTSSMSIPFDLEAPSIDYAGAVLCRRLASDILSGKVR